MRDYTLLQPLTVDGKLRPVGTVVALSDALADWLNGIGVISKAGATVPQPVSAPVPALLAPRKVKRCRGCGW